MEEQVLKNIVESIINKNTTLNKETVEFLKENKNYYKLLKIYLTERCDYEEYSHEQVVKRLNHKIKIDTLSRSLVVKKQSLVKSVLIAITSTAAILILLFSLYNSLENNDVEQKKFSFIMPYNNKASIILSDGTTIILKPGSKIDYNNFDECDTREVTLNGEAFFDVAKADKKFIVKSENSTIVVKGTKFNVKANSYDDFIETTLIEGSVMFLYKNSYNRIDSINMEPRDRVVYNKIYQEYKKVVINEPNEYIANDEYKFDNVPLSRVFEIVRSIYDVDVVIAPSADSIRYTGAIRRSHTMKNTMELITETTKLKYNYINHRTIKVTKR